jgi:hypothetical protein
MNFRLVWLLMRRRSATQLIVGGSFPWAEAHGYLQSPLRGQHLSRGAQRF